MLDEGHHLIIGVGMSLIPIDHVCRKGEEATLLGYFWPHLAKGSEEPCPAYFMHVCKQHGAKEQWDVEVGGSQLTLKPSLLCERCGLHGFVTKGRWTGDIEVVRSATSHPTPLWQKKQLYGKQYGGKVAQFFNGKRVQQHSLFGGWKR